MGLISTQFPFTDPGSLQGGIREHRAILNGLQADAFRSASQSQKTGQAARAFSGAIVTNDQTQTATLSQTATAENNKTVTFTDTTATNPFASGFTDNFLQKYIAGANAADWLARGAANVAQEQGGDQSAFSRLNDFDGVDSDASNTLTQDAMITQVFDVDLTATIDNTTDASSDDGVAYQEARFRHIIGDLSNQHAQAIFTSGQRQGSASAPSSQVAIGDGADADNDVTQTATVVMIGNDVTLEADFNLARDPAETATLTSRSAELLAKIAGNGAVNSSAASQEQVHVQSAAGGVNEDGQATENGKGTAVSNTGDASASTVEETIVLNSVTITI